MPGFEFFKTTERAASPAVVPASVRDATPEPTSNGYTNGYTNGHTGVSPAPEVPEVYYNARLDPTNYLEGPLSPMPATRLRQMLARPGIVVAPGICDGISARAAMEAGFTCLYQRFVSFLIFVRAAMDAYDVLPVVRLLRLPALACPIWLLLPSTISWR